MSDYPVILGVYSLKKTTEIGLGDSMTKRETLSYWYARQLGPETFEVQPLNIYHVPSGVKQEVGTKEFLKNYNPEPQYYKSNTVPALQSLAAKIAKGQELFDQGQLDQAEKQFLKSLMIDDQNVKANYGLGQVYTEKQEFDKLRKVLNTLLYIDAAFAQEHREQFNSFGISLRKNKCYDESIRFYARALELNAMDEHVYFNMARAYYEKGAMEECLTNLNIALAVNPDFAEAKKFLEFCQKNPSAKESTAGC